MGYQVNVWMTGKYLYINCILLIVVIIHFPLFALDNDSAEIETVPNARISLKNIPSDVEFYLNGLQKVPDAHGVIAVSSGLSLLEIKMRRVVVYSALLLLEKNEVKPISFNCSESCALLHVITEPSGATLSMNGTILGLTPYMNRFLKPGSYSIMATLPGHIPVIRRIELSSESEIESYSMQITKGAVDSLEAAKKALVKKKHVNYAMAFGAFSLGMGGLGAYYDWKAYRYLKRAEKASDAYDVAQTKRVCDKYKNTYYHERSRAEKQMNYRKYSYIASAASFLGFFYFLSF